MKTCTICDYHYSDSRTHCPVCGAIPTIQNYVFSLSGHILKVAHGAERASQNLYTGRNAKQVK